MLLIDAHLDLAMNALEWNRDLRMPVHEINELEKNMNDKPGRGQAMVSFPELQKAGIGLVVATLIARYASPGHPMPGWNAPELAWAQTQGQLAWYHAMERAGHMTPIKNLEDLEKHIALCLARKGDESLPLGYILSLEGADSILQPADLEQAYANGLRAVGPAHYGPGRYAFGTDSDAPLNASGKELLRVMDSLNMVLDLTHLCDSAFWEAINLFKGVVWASHNNVRSLVPHNRQFSDDQIKALLERNAVIGVALDAWMMVPDWQRGLSTPAQMNCNLEKITDHIDHICQLAGNCLNVGIGSDLDGGFGKEQAPMDLETIADLPKLSGLLRKKGYAENDIAQIFSGNWLRIFREAFSKMKA